MLNSSTNNLALDGLIKSSLQLSSSRSISEDYMFNIPLEVLLVDQEIAKELQCGICLQLLANPKQCKNGHLFCYQCIIPYIERNPECPQCRCSLKETELARSLFVERHLRLLKVYCRFRFVQDENSIDGWSEDSEGCKEVLIVENAEKHERSCEYALVPCKYSLKCGKIRKRNLENHENVCPSKPIECPHCKLPVEQSKIDDHLRVCSMLPIKCEKCGMDVKRTDTELHKYNICPEVIISCQFFDQGCNTKLLRKHLFQHLQENVGEHMSLLKKSMDEQVSSLKNSFDVQLRLRDDKIKQLEKMIGESEVKIEWKIKNWSVSKKKSYLQSDKFSFADFNWFIGLYTDGDSEESRGFISLYLFLDVSSATKSKSVTLEFNVIFVNHKDSSDSVKKDFKTTFPIKGGQGWGDRKAIKLVRLTEDNGFLKKDSLFVELSLHIKRVSWLLQG